MAPTGAATGNRNASITRQLGNWAKRDGTGAVFDSSTGFKLPNGADRSPDAAWIPRSRLRTLTSEQKEKFLPLCPDFVIELLSPTDTLSATQAKMTEYIENGSFLGWLIDPAGARFMSTARARLPPSCTTLWKSRPIPNCRGLSWTWGRFGSRRFRSLSNVHECRPGSREEFKSGASTRKLISSTADPFHTICGKLCGDRLASCHNFLSCNTSSRLHSPAASGDSLFDQSLACMKQRLDRRTEFLSIARGRLFLLLALFLLALSYGGCVKRSRDPRLSARSNAQAPASSQAISKEANDQQSGD
ncbi:MAG: hypothetical protein QOF72_534 [Blastocatellia bacterium]|nr:hypothetical protein [Blastocatellia bacterium]